MPAISSLNSAFSWINRWECILSNAKKAAENAAFSVLLVRIYGDILSRNLAPAMRKPKLGKYTHLCPV